MRLQPPSGETTRAHGVSRGDSFFGDQFSPARDDTAQFGAVPPLRGLRKLFNRSPTGLRPWPQSFRRYAASFFILLAFGCARQPELARYGAVPNFSLTERSGQTVSLSDLADKVWIADFIFTSCAGACPSMTANMSKLQKMLPPEIRMVSFTVDPRRDTMKVLADYADHYGADKERWLFLTGERENLYNLSIKGFKLAIDDTMGTEAEPITHSTRFALVDRQGQIRGYYSGIEDEDLKRLSADAKRLL